MYKVYLYEDESGNSPIYDYIQDLSKRTDKSSRINLNKIREYVKYLRLHGQAAGEPFIKHIDGDIWELRPIRNRILFAAWSDNGFILLHHFIKKTQKTPAREIEQAKRNLKDIKERGISNERVE
ncbi:MAG: type II toxin-antitoxin system RelE/ParE family toxin [Deferribacteraceae bacterium]|jgi:phage-related protein|nr:type II toxin-antitoxin system RelE/ParE family toxin [Deferribacteraceae bacterium]